MITTIMTVFLVGAFFILFFKPTYSVKNKTVEKEKPSATAGFIEDTYRGPFVDHFIPPKYGDVGTFVSYSSVPENHWLHGFPHEKA
jgi:hypothetical protein